jgi:hypothetical protein
VIPNESLIPRTRLADRSCSIVFVHGLTGSRLSTWTSKESKTVWPKTLLSNNIPNARILTLGYDADVVNYWAPASQKRVKEHAKDLNNALCDLRDTTNTVSIETILCMGIFCLQGNEPRSIDLSYSSRTALVE